MPSRRKCPVCGSKKWHKEPFSGLIACSEGHVLQNYRNETTEKDEFGIHALRKRTLKSTRKKKEKASKADPNLYHGNQARFLYFQCLQLLLRRQIAALILLWDLPTEFEHVCRDVWALHLRLLPTPPPAELSHDEPAVTEESESKRAGLSPPRAPRPTAAAPRKSASSPDSDASSSRSSSSSTSSSSDKSEDEQDQELEDLMRELSGSGSESDPGPAGAERTTAGVAARRRKGNAPQESPLGNLAVLVVALWTLRIPIIYADLTRLIEKYDLPYLDPVRRRVLPPDMVLHLNKQTVQALSPPFAPRPTSIHTHASRLARLLHARFGIATPEANAAPLLWRAVCALAGPPVVYQHAKRLARVLGLPLVLHRALAPTLGPAPAQAMTHKLDDVAPEVALVACVIVVLKLVYGLDGQPRVPAREDEAAAALPSLEDYLAAVRAALTADAQTPDTLFSARHDLRAEGLAAGTLDAYLAFSATALLGDAPAPDGYGLLDVYFPWQARANKRGGRTRGGEANAGTRDSCASVRAQVSAVDAHAAVRPGEQYRVYDARDDGGELPEEYELLLKRAAGWAGVRSEEVGRCVERLERRLVRWWKDEKRAGVGDDDDERLLRGGRSKSSTSESRSVSSGL